MEPNNNIIPGLGNLVAGVNLQIERNNEIFFIIPENFIEDVNNLAVGGVTIFKAKILG